MTTNGKIIMTIGCPGSGKSTWAKQYMAQDDGAVRVNKDDLRNLIYNGVWSKDREKFILTVRDRIVSLALAHGLTVIVDDTNLAPYHEKALRLLANKFMADFVVKDFRHVPLDECIARDAQRTGTAMVGEEVIRGMYAKYLTNAAA